MQALSEPLADAVGRRHRPASAICRIVSLVPSLTELLFALDLGERVVGRTGFCVHPKPAVRKVPKVGGTKDFDLDKLRALEATHLIVNVDENPREGVDAAAKFVPNVIVTHPMGPLDNVPLYRLFGAIFDRERAAESLAQRFEEAYRQAVATVEKLPQQRVLYLIWKDPWMTISRDTYIARTLAAVRWEQIDVDSPERYPAIDLEPRLGSVDAILLSSEPYAFRQRDVRAVTDLLHIHAPVPGHAVATASVSLIDAQMTSWYGSRAIEGMRYLAALRTARTM